MAGLASSDPFFFFILFPFSFFSGFLSYKILKKRVQYSSRDKSILNRRAMNSAALRSLSALLAPGGAGWSRPPSSMACNRWGDLFALTQDSAGSCSSSRDGHRASISFRPLKSNADSNGTRELPLLGKDVTLLAQTQCLEFNLHGTMLLAWGPTCALLITLPPSYANLGDTAAASSSFGETGAPLSGDIRSIFDSSNAAAGEGDINYSDDAVPGDFEIIKAQWHPFNNECIVLLIGGKSGSRLIVLNVLSGKATPILLSAHADYRSFTFGPRSGCGGWMAVSVLVLSADGRVTVVCPVLPVGSVLPASLALEILQAVADDNKSSSALMNSSPGRAAASVEQDAYHFTERNSLLTLSKIFVSAAFGDMSSAYFASDSASVVVGAPLIDADAIASDAHYLVNLAPEGSTNSAGSLKLASSRDSVLRCMLDWPPSCQGAMLNPDDLSKYIRGKGASPVKQTSRDSASAPPSSCDICVLPGLDHTANNSETSAPVLAIARSDGSVDVFVCVGEIRPHWNSEGLMLAHPDWSLADKNAFCASLFGEDDPYHRSDLLDDSILLFRLPELICVETVANDTTSQSAGAKWSVRPDPVVPHIFHHIGVDAGICSAVVVHWLADALAGVDDASVAATGDHGSASPIYKLSNVAKSSHRESSAIVSTTRAPSEVMHYFPTSSWHASNDGKHTISGLVIISDAFLGHIAVTRTFCEGISGKPAFSTVTSVNLSVFISSRSQEKRLMQQMQSTVYHEPSNSSHSLTLNSEDAFHKIASTVLSDAKRALQEVKLRLAQFSRDKSSGGEYQKKELSEIWQFLEENVVNKLEEFQLRLRFTTETVQDMYKAQLELLLGSTDGKGLKDKIVQLRDKKVNLESRLSGISSNLEIEMQLCAGILAFGGSKARGLTAAEKEYRNQLLEWSNATSRLAPLVDEVERLQLKQQEELVGVPVTPMSPVPRASRFAIAGQEEELAQLKQLKLNDSASLPDRSITLPTAPASAAKPSSFLTPLSHANLQSPRPSNMDDTVTAGAVAGPEARWTLHSFGSPSAKKPVLPRRMGLNRGTSSDSGNVNALQSPPNVRSLRPAAAAAMSTPVVQKNLATQSRIDEDLLQRLGAKVSELVFSKTVLFLDY